MKKIILLASLAFSINAFAQLPNYLPTNGLVAYYPFTGNANDISTIGNNGTVNGATLTSDRFGAANSAYNFNGTNNYITAPNNTNFPAQNFTFSIWFKAVYNGNLNYNSGLGRYLYEKGAFPCPVRAVLNAAQNSPASDISTTVITVNANGGSSNTFNDPNDLWHHYVITYNGVTQIDYIDGVVTSSVALTGALITNLGELTIGCRINPSYQDFFLGKIDDFGIWNRALTQQEITAVYNGNICYQNVTVTDTLLINTSITGFNPITYKNTIKVWPNPTNDHITIDNGNIANLNGYQIKITNSLSQQVFQSAITQQQFYVDLSTWTGNGIYFVHIIDGQGNTIDIKKIVLQ